MNNGNNFGQLDLKHNNSILILINASINLYMNNFFTYLKIVLPLAVPGIILHYILLRYFMPGLRVFAGHENLSDPVYAQEQFQTLIKTYPGLIPLLIGILIFYQIIVISIIIITYNIVNKKQSTLKDVVFTLADLSLPLFLTGLMVLVLIVTGGLLFFIPAALAIIYLIFTFHVIVLERKYYLNALIGSFQLSAGNFLKIAGSLLLLFSLYFLITIALELVFTAIISGLFQQSVLEMQQGGSEAGENSWGLAMYIIFGFTVLASIIFLPVIHAFFTLLYLNMRGIFERLLAEFEKNRDNDQDEEPSDDF